jgi:hypothetical protein
MSFKDWIGYIVQKLVWYMETPRLERKEIKKLRSESWQTRWFGLIPFSMKMYVQKQHSKIRRSMHERKTKLRK